MKNITLLSVLLASIGIAHAVPTAINYQGRLTDGDGNPASGSKLFSLSLYDAATAGNELYAETIGSIAVDENGIYNFQFGANGTSTVAADEVIATTDGSSQVFNATLSELPVDGSVSIADGIYTWSQAGGSSAPSEFTGSVTVGTGAISAIYLSGAPSSGTDITASYDYSESGVSGALRTGSAHWIELSIDGDTQSPRERVLSVPFAIYCLNSIDDISSDKEDLYSTGNPNAYSPQLYVSENGDDSLGDGTSEAPFATIQKAIDVSYNGDTIIVKPGTYFGIGNRNLLVANKEDLSIMAESGPNVTVVDCGDSTPAIRFSGAFNITFSGFTITRGYYNASSDWDNGGIIVIENYSSPIIENCIIKSNVIVSSYSTAQPALLYARSYSAASVRNCLIVDNSVTGGSYYQGGLGRIVRLDKNSSLVNCTVVNNTVGGNLRSSIDSSGIVINVIDWGNDGAQVYTPSLSSRWESVVSDTIQHPGVVSQDPSFENSTTYTVSAESPCVDTGKNMIWMENSTDLGGYIRISNNVVDIGAHEKR